MSHGESQEKGQEESQEEVVLLALCQKAREKLSRSPLNSKTMPASSGHRRFRGRYVAKHWKTSCGARCAGIHRGRKSSWSGHRQHGESAHRRTFRARREARGRGVELQ